MTLADIIKLVEATKDYSLDDIRAIAYGLSRTVGAIYVSKMESMYGIKIYL